MTTPIHPAEPAQQHGFLQAVVFSFFSRSLYQDVARRWKGLGFLYLFTALAILWTITMVKVHLNLKRVASEEAPAVVSQVPFIEIRNGKVTVHAEQPYEITDPKSGELLAILDTTGKVTSLDEHDSGILLTESKLMYKKNAVESRSYDLSGIESFEMDQDKVQGWVDVFSSWFALATYPVALVFSFVYRLLQTLLYGAIGTTLGRWRRVELPYKTSVRLAAIAVTPALVVATLVSGTAVAIPWTVYFLLTLAYLFFAVSAVAGPPAAPEQGGGFPGTPGRG